MTITIGDNLFQSKKELETYIQSIIKRIGVTRSIKIYDIKIYNFFIELLMHHPNSNDKLNGIIDLSIVENERWKNKELMIVKKKETEDISWRICV